MNNAYSRMRRYKINESMIIKTEKRVQNTMNLCRDLKLSVTSSIRLFEDYIIY